MSRRIPCTLLTLAFVAALAACGGGGGGDSASDTTPPPATPSGAEPSCGSAAFRDQVLAQVNALRARARSCGTKGSFAATGALGWSSRLEAAADGHAQDMLANDFVGHTGSNGSNQVARVEAQGYNWQALAENVAGGPTTITAVMQGWIASDGHCANIMNPGLTEIGVACRPGSARSTYAKYWAMNLGTPL